MAATFHLLSSWLRKSAPAARPTPPRARPHLVALEDRCTPAAFTVMNTNDAGPGSLRQAVADAAANTEDDTIDFDLALSGQKVTLLTPIAFPNDPRAITVSAPTSSTTIDGGGATQLFTVAAGATVKLQSFTFSGGKAADGGAIFNMGTLIVSSATFVGNQATNDGGAVSNQGTLTIDQVVFSNNKAGGNGGAIASVGSAAIGAPAVAVLTRSTVGASLDFGPPETVRPGNTAANGGGIFNGTDAKLFVINSTVHKNTATTAGGGVQNVSALFAKFTNSTVAFNTGGGVNTGTGGVTFANNTIVIGNTGGDINGANVGTSMNNLVGDAATAGGLADGKDGNIVGQTAAAVLGDLFTQFGTPFYPLAKNSPAIDKGSNALAVDEAGTALTTDQNPGSARISPDKGTVDIGSREFVTLAAITLTGLPASLNTPQDKTAIGAFTGVNISTDTTTTPVLVTFAATKGTFTIPDKINNVTNITGSGTGTISFQSVNDGGALGALAAIDYVPPPGVTFPQTAGETITVTAKNTATNDVKSGTVKLSVGAAAPATPTPVGFNFGTPVGTARPVIVIRNPASGNEVTAFQFTDITNGKLFRDDKLTQEVTNGDSVPIPADAKGVPTQSFLTLFFQPTAGFTGTAKFDARASAPAGQSDPLTSTVQVVAATTPIVPADNPAFQSNVGPRLAGATSYDFTVNYADDAGIDVSKLGDGDIKVTGRTGGFVGVAKFLGATAAGKEVTATYRITPPGGSWDGLDNGSYVISLAANEVFDTAGTAAPAQDLTSFDVNLAADPAGTPSAKLTAAAVDATSAGKTSYTFTVTYADDTAIDATTINAKDLIVVLGPNGYITSAEFVSVDKTGNGTPLTATYKITPPGGDFDTSDNGTYSVVLGGFVLDDAKNFTTPGGLGTFTVNIPGADTTAPTAKLGAAAAVGDTSKGATTYDFTITYTDNVAVNATSFDGKDARVTGPNGFNALASFVKADTAGNGTPRTVTYRITPPGGSWDSADNGTYTIAVEAGQVLDTAGNKVAAGNLGTFAVNVSATGTASPVLVGFPQFAVGTDASGNGSVQFFNPDKSSRLIDPLTPFGNFTGGVRTAAADFNADGVADVIAGTGPGRATRVVVLDGATQTELFAVDPFEAAFTGGVYITAGDLNGDGTADLVITPDEGGGPRCRVFSGKGFGQIADFFGIEDTAFRGGARAAVGDITGDGRGDLVVAAGFGGGPRVAVFDGTSLAGGKFTTKPFGDFFAFETGLRNGTFVTAGDINADGKAELVAGGGPGGGPRVTAFSGADLLANKQTVLANFFAGDVNNRGGVRVAVKNLDGDAKADLVVGSGTGGGSRVTAYLGTALAAGGSPAEQFAFDAVPGFTGGVFVG